MSIPYRHTEKITINQHRKLPTGRDLASRDALLLMLPSAAACIDWQQLPHGDFLAQRARQRQSDRDPPGSWETELPNPRGTRVLVVYCDSDASSFTRQTAARRWSKRLLAGRPASIAVIAAAESTAAALHEAALLALLAAVCPLPTQKSQADPPARLQRIDCYGCRDLPIERIRAQIQGNHLARWLTQLPGNALRPADYRANAATLAKRYGWKLQFLDQRALEKHRAGAFLAVTQAGSRDAGILKLSYRPRGHTRHPRLALVGKGICFDTGGVNLKSAKSMYGMHEDMEGSAVALGTLLACTLLKVDFAIDCWLALAENHIGPAGYKPNDVVTASNGTSIEIVHTDAEGRMVLADTLSLCGKDKPDLIIDYATLTGACVYALSTRYSGVFSNRDALLPLLTDAGKASGERVWPFPLDEDFDDMLKSDSADIRQCTIESEADHILAARFLKRFIPASSAWVHIDLAAGNHKGGLAYIPSDITGFGVGLTLQALLQGRILSVAASNAEKDSA